MEDKKLFSSEFIRPLGKLSSPGWLDVREELLKIIEEISSTAYEIRCDWSDPRTECRLIMSLCESLKEKIAPPGTDKG